MKNNNEVKANTKSANPFNPTSTGGGLHSNVKVTIGADAQAEYQNLPRQIQLNLNYVFDLGGTATMGDINAFSETASGNQFWGRGDSSYEQTPSKVIAHYSPKVFGDKEWSKKLGKLEIFKIVK
tara:strand:+ start:254 stop:625 length:372 start_codon:yes stop_codon:yes gene_type:complete